MKHKDPRDEKEYVDPQIRKMVSASEFGDWTPVRDQPPSPGQHNVCY